MWGLIFTMSAHAQTVIVTDDPAYTTGQTSAALDVKSTTKGFLLPRMTQAQRVAITSPAEGLLVFQTDGGKGLYYYINSAWTVISSGAAGPWSLTGNSGTNSYFNFLGTTDNTSLRIRTNNTVKMTLDSMGHVGIGVINPANRLVVKDTMEIRHVAGVSQLLFTNTSGIGIGDFRIAGDGADIFWQGGGGRALQMGSYHTTILGGDRQINTFPAYIDGTTLTNTGVLVKAQRDASVALAFQPNSASQTANITEWRDAAGSVMNAVSPGGQLGIATATPAASLDVAGTFKLGTDGSVLNHIVKTSVVITDNTNITYTVSLTKTATVTGATTTSTVIVNPRTALPNGVNIAWARVSASNTVQINFTNTGAGLFGNQVLGTVTFDITIIQ